MLLSLIYGEWIWGDNLGGLIAGTVVMGQVSGWQETEKTTKPHEPLEVEAMVLFVPVNEEYLGIKEDLSSRRN